MFKDKKNNWVIGNWKLNPVFEDAKNLYREVAQVYASRVDLQQCHVAIAPPAPYLAYFVAEQDKTVDSNVAIVSQDVSVINGLGAYTGETSADLLAHLGVPYVLIGHSERRELFGDDVETLQRKIQQARQSNLTIIYCVGESLQQRESGQAQQVVLQQIADLSAVLNVDDWQNILIAYEPIWAIGTGKTASPADAQEMHAAIRQSLKQYTACAQDIALLYGGSVKPENAVELAACADIDGALVGGASLSATSSILIIEAFAQSK